MSANEQVARYLSKASTSKVSTSPVAEVRQAVYRCANDQVAAYLQKSQKCRASSETPKKVYLSANDQVARYLKKGPSVQKPSEHSTKPPVYHSANEQVQRYLNPSHATPAVAPNRAAAGPRAHGKLDVQTGSILGLLAPILLKSETVKLDIALHPTPFQETLVVNEQASSDTLAILDKLFEGSALYVSIDSNELHRQWGKFAVDFSTQNAGLPALTPLNEYLKTRAYIIGWRVSLTDLVIWAAVHATVRSMGVMNQQRYVHVSRWFNQVQHVLDLPGLVPIFQGSLPSHFL